MPHHAPDGQLTSRLDEDFRVGVVRRQQLDLAPALVQALHGQFPVDLGHHDAAVLGGEGPVHDQETAIRDVGTRHRVAFDPQKEGRFLVPDQVLVQVEHGLHVIVRGRREAGRDFVPVERPASRRRVHRGQVEGLCAECPDHRHDLGNMRDEAHRQPYGSRGLAVWAARASACARAFAAPCGFFDHLEKCNINQDGIWTLFFPSGWPRPVPDRAMPEAITVAQPTPRTPEHAHQHRMHQRVAHPGAGPSGQCLRVSRYKAHRAASSFC